MKFIPTTLTQLNKIKDRAKELRPQFERLGHARDVAAREAGYDDFHHAFRCAAGHGRRLTGVGTHQSIASETAIINLVLSRLEEVLVSDPAVDLRNPRVLAAMNDRQGLRTAALLTKAVHLAYGETYYAAALKDYNALATQGFPPANLNTSSDNRATAPALWQALQSEENAPAFHLLYSYCYIRIFSGYASWLNTADPGDAGRGTVEQLLYVMQVLMERSDADEALDFLHGPADELMPLEANRSVHTGQLDTDDRSTWWSRIQGAVSIEMVGTCSILPYAGLRKYIADGSNGRLPFALLYTPQDAKLLERYTVAARARWAALPV